MPAERRTDRASKRRRRHSGVGLGRTQKLVLRLLASGHKSTAHLAYDWPTLTESAAASAIARLGDRGLVDVADLEESWGSVRRTYKLTARGFEVERALNVDDEERPDA